MSKEAALQFLKAVDKTPALQEQLRSRGLDRDRTPESEANLINIAAASGYHFTIEDLAAAAKGYARQRMQIEEIDEEELDHVAGGYGCHFTGTCGDTCLSCLLTLW